MREIKNLIKILTKPRSFFKDINKTTIKGSMIYILILSILFYIPYLIKIILKFKNNELMVELGYFSLLLQPPVNIWVIIYFILLLAIIFAGFLLVSLILSLIIKLISYCIKNKFTFKKVNKIVTYSLFPLVIEQYFVLILYLMKIETINLSFLFYIYTAIMIVIGLVYSKNK